MHRLHIISTGLIILLVSTFAQAQSRGRNLIERASNTRQIKASKDQLERDKKELAKFKKDIAVLETAYTTKEFGKVATLRKNLVEDMKREIAQSKVKKEQAEREIAQSKSEMRSNNREIRHDRRDFSRGNNTADDRNDLVRDHVNRVDDRRDKRDDKNDLEDIIKRHNNQKKILDAFQATSNIETKAAATESISYLQQFSKTLVKDLEATERELREDKGEQREDRRETRDDFRERRERR
ncbi:MAG: DUF724 domain-containing protein [Saprospiraceae bacterium]|nr:DUF724 domain-containing protein [Saprospiraceae bacterium]